MKTYKAPWSGLLVSMSAIATGICLAAAVVIVLVGRHAWVGVLPVFIVVSGLLLIVRDYTIGGDCLEIRRLLWTTRIPLRGLESVQAQPDVMRRSMRVFGNGGLFSFTGWYRNEELGSYRAYVTDLNRTVVLRYAKRAIVLSPSEPEQFVEEIRTRLGVVVRA